MKKQLYGKNIVPACRYCSNGRLCGGKKVLCEEKGVMDPDDSCRKFTYDPLLRQPKPVALPPKHSPDEFKL